MKICCIGELLVDFTPMEKSKVGNPVFEQNPGGGPANVSVATSMLGLETSFIGKVGNDTFGIRLKKELELKNVNTKGMLFSKEFNTTLAFVHLDENNDRSFSFYRKPGADIMLTKDEVDYSIIDECDLLHFTSVTLTDEPVRTATIEAVKYAKKKGKIISYDPNLRESLWTNLEEAKEYIVKMLDYADILKISEEEAVFITGEENIELAAKQIFAKYSKILFVTLGAKGAMYLHKSGSNYMNTYKRKVVDTTGCGDAFVGAIIYNISKCDKDIEDLNKKELDYMMDFANKAGTYVAMRKGGIPSMPSVKEVESIC